MRSHDPDAWLQGAGASPSAVRLARGAAVMRAHAYREVGGCEPRRFLGAEEALRGLDPVSRGWRIVRRGWLRPVNC